jgi:hypothetical protein
MTEKETTLKTRSAVQNTDIRTVLFGKDGGEEKCIQFSLWGNVLGIIHLEDRERDKRLTLR